MRSIEASDAKSRGCGVMIQSPSDLDQVRSHLRRFLIVALEDGRQMYFRFYDPRVMSVFLPTCTAEQLREFFGPIEAFWADSEDGASVSKFTLTDGALHVETFPADGRSLADDQPAGAIVPSLRSC